MVPLGLNFERTQYADRASDVRFWAPGIRVTTNPQIVTICNSKVVPPNESAQEFHNQGLTWPCCQIWLVLSKPCYPFSYPFVKRCLVGASSLHGLFLIWKLSYFSQLHGISGIPTYTNCDGDMIGVGKCPVLGGFWTSLSSTWWRLY